MTKHCDQDPLLSSSRAVTKVLAACGALALYFHVLPSSSAGLNTPALQRGQCASKLKSDSIVFAISCHRPVLCVVRLYRNDVNYCGVKGLEGATLTCLGLIVFSCVSSHLGLSLEEYILCRSSDFQ